MEKISNYVDQLYHFVIIGFIAINFDQISSIPNKNELVIFLACIGIVNYVVAYLLERKQIQNSEISNINSQFDNLNRIEIFIYMTGAIYYIISRLNFDLASTEIVMFSLLFLALLIVSFTNKVTNYFRKIPDTRINFDNNNFYIDSDDSKIEYSQFAIRRIDKDGNIKELKEINLNKEEAKKFKKWTCEKLNDPKIEFYWREKGNLELIS